LFSPHTGHHWPGVAALIVGQSDDPDAMKIRSKALWVLGILVLVVVGQLILGQLLTPNYATRAGLERRFASQIRRLAEIASDPKGQWNTSVEVCEADKRLFKDPAILEASVEPTPGSHLIVGGRCFDWSSEMSVPLNFARRVHMVRYWYTTTNRSRVSAVSYKSYRVDSGGQTVAFTLIADISQLRR
jgi:hypothetical protein